MLTRASRCSIHPTRTIQPLNQLINLPIADWTAARLACFKTENFTFTGNRDLNKARKSIGLATQLGFPPSQSSHLVGIGDYTTPWAKELRLALGEGIESVVLFALDQFCLIGYGFATARWSQAGVVYGGVRGARAPSSGPGGSPRPNICFGFIELRRLKATGSQPPFRFCAHSGHFTKPTADGFPNHLPVCLALPASLRLPEYSAQQDTDTFRV